MTEHRTGLRWQPLTREFIACGGLTVHQVNHMAPLARTIPGSPISHGTAGQCPEGPIVRSGSATRPRSGHGTGRPMRRHGGSRCLESRKRGDFRADTICLSDRVARDAIIGNRAKRLRHAEPAVATWVARLSEPFAQDLRCVGPQAAMDGHVARRCDAACRKARRRTSPQQRNLPTWAAFGTAWSDLA